MYSHPHATIGIGIVCYIDKESQLPELQRCLDSVSQFYPVFVIDGKWNDVKGNINTSIDKAYDLIESYSNVIHVLSPNRPEFVNRNRYHRLAMLWQLDYLISLDTDEYVEFTDNKAYFMSNIDDKALCSYLKCTGKGHGGTFETQKLYRYPGFMRHKLKHNELFFLDKDVRKYASKAPDGIIIHHDKDFRDGTQKDKLLTRARLNPIH